MLNALLFTAIGFVAMESFGWFIHKYLMHGPLWSIHKTHHQPSKGMFEANDLFSFSFGSIALILIFSGLGELDYRFWLGIGISVYGGCYFVLHDMLIHRRVKAFGRPKNRILKGIFKAHQAHHISNKKEGAVSFGLFLIQKKYFNKE
jgi:beta-carotene 3-hydroxylase